VGRGGGGVVRGGGGGVKCCCCSPYITWVMKGKDDIGTGV